MAVQPQVGDVGLELGAHPRGVVPVGVWNQVRPAPAAHRKSDRRGRRLNGGRFDDQGRRGRDRRERGHHVTALERFVFVTQIYINISVAFSVKSSLENRSRYAI